MTTEPLLMESIKDQLYVTVLGDIDHHSTKKLREEIDHAIFYHRPKKLILVLSQVSFMDSSGLGLILGRFTRMQEIGGKMAIAEPTPQIVKILKLCGLEKKIPIEQDSRQTAHQQEPTK